MRKLRSVQSTGITVQEMLDEFNERREERGIVREEDIVSVFVMPPTNSVPIHSGKVTAAPTVEVVIVY